jgi:hypothetical protein
MPKQLFVILITKREENPCLPSLFCEVATEKKKKNDNPVKVSDQTNMHHCMKWCAKCPILESHLNNVWLTKKHKHICGAAIHLATTTTTT